MGRARRKWRKALEDFGRSRWLPIVAFGWLAIVVCFFLWELDRYRGLTALIAEWEYEKFGQHLPWMTLIFLVAIFAVPVLLLLSFLRNRVRARQDVDQPGVVHSVVRSERALFNFLALGSGIVLFVGLVALIWTIFLPSADGKATAINLGPTAVAPAEGPATVSGMVLYRRTATFQQDVLWLRRGVQFAPIVAANGRDRPVRYFVELSIDAMPQSDAEAEAVTFSGILRRNSLPGPIVSLFRYAGIEITQPHYVLYASRTSMCWPYYVIAFNCLIAGVFLLLLALIQRRRLSRTMARSVQFSG